MVRYLRRLLAVLPCLVACAAWAQTETALIADSADGGGPGGGTFFILVSHNGQATDNDAIRASSQASFGRGAYMRVVGHARQVPAGKATLVLRGTQTHTAPIDTIFRAIFRGGSPEVSGSIEVELKPGASYRVNGVVDTYQREVWLEEVGSKAIVGNKVVAPADPELLKAMEGAQHVCCNLRYEGDWISDSAWPHLPFVPAGARIKVQEISGNRAWALIDGRKMRIGNDYGRERETMAQMVARLAVPTDPRLRIAGFDAPVRDAIRAGKATPGMTRDQVLIALGRPRLAHTPDLQAKEWLYLLDNNEEAFVVFDAEGRVQAFDGSRKARGFLWLAPLPEVAAAPAAAPKASSAPAAPSSAPSAASAAAPAAEAPR